MHTQFCKLEMLKMVTEIENGSVTLTCIDISKLQSSMYDDYKFTHNRGDFHPISVKMIKTERYIE